MTIWTQCGRGLCMHVYLLAGILYCVQACKETRQSWERGQRFCLQRSAGVTWQKNKKQHCDAPTCDEPLT